MLADALADADDETPELLIDIATLTGAARVATGMELPPFFTDDEKLAADLMRHAARGAAIRCGGCRCGAAMKTRLTSRGRRSQQQSQLRSMPAPSPPRCSSTALSKRPKAGCIWIFPAWIDRAKPGRRIGGEANGARALYALLKERYGR